MNLSQIRDRARKLVGLDRQDLLLDRATLNQFFEEAQVELVRRALRVGLVPANLRRRVLVDLQADVSEYHLPDALTFITVKAVDSGGNWQTLTRATWEDLDYIAGGDWENASSGIPQYYYEAGQETSANSYGQMKVRLYPAPSYSATNGLQFRIVARPRRVADLGTNSAVDLIDIPVEFHDALAHKMALRHLESHTEPLDTTRFEVYSRIWERAVEEYQALWAEQNRPDYFPDMGVPLARRQVKYWANY